MFSPIVHPLALLALSVTSYVDIKIREVPDWISYGLMFAGIGIRAIYSVAEHKWIYFLEGVFGLIVMFLFGCLLYYTGQWGGGDSKLLTGLGALFGMNWTTPLQFSIYFLLLLFVVGAGYGIIWSGYLFFTHRDKCGQHFMELHKSGYGGKKFILWGSLVVITSALIIFDLYISTLLFIIALAMVTLYYSWLILHVLEKTCMQKYVFPAQLTEGDWIVEDVLVNEKRICGPSDLGVSKEQINELKKYYEKKQIGKILIKDGIPFVPSFLLAYLILLALQIKTI